MPESGVLLPQTQEAALPLSVSLSSDAAAAPCMNGGALPGHSTPYAFPGQLPPGTLHVLRGALLSLISPSGTCTTFWVWE